MVKKNRYNRQDEMRAKKLNDALFRTAKTTDSIFVGGKSEFYPKKEKTSNQVKKFTKKAISAVKSYVNNKSNNKIAKK